MQIGRVVGTVVSTQKNRKLEGAKLLLVQPLTLEGEPREASTALSQEGLDRLVAVTLGRAGDQRLPRLPL